MNANGASLALLLVFAGCATAPSNGAGRTTVEVEGRGTDGAQALADGLKRAVEKALGVLQAGGDRAEPHLRMCGWCKKVHDGAAWVELEAAIAKSGLFDGALLPAVTHGICEECEAAMNKTLSEGR